ncbi:MAG: hypothetical protein WBF33_19655 [Candidatus Nitrosopolaris sp.]|jgi:hypothetical protein
MDNNIDNNFQRSFMRSGNFLESETINSLSKYFQIRERPTFLDLDEGKSRDGDILAKETFPAILDLKSKRMVAQLILSLECKSLPDHGWIFTEGKMKQYFWYFSLLRNRNIIEENVKPENPLNELVGTNSFFEAIADNKPKNELKTNKQTNNIHDASLKVIKLTRHLINEDLRQAKILYRDFNKENEITFLKIYQPIIVFNGNLYLKKMYMEKIIRTKYLQLSRQYTTAGYDEDVTIHIVASGHIEEYLKIIRSYYMSGATYILENQSSIRERVKEDLIHWNDFNPFKSSISE